MRRISWLAAIGLAASWAGAGQAQETPFAGYSGPLKFQVVKTQAPEAPIAGPEYVSQPTSPTRFFRSSPGRITNQSVLGQSHFPTESQMPGEDYLRAFHVKRYGRRVPLWWAPWTWF